MAGRRPLEQKRTKMGGTSHHRIQVLVLQGPNLNRLGIREPEIYGRLSLSELCAEVDRFAQTLAIRTTHLQSNHEGLLIDALHAADGHFDGVLFNPGAFTHYSYALRDAVASLRTPCVEVHLSDIQSREEWRRKSVIAPVCIAQVYGKGVDSYKDGLRLLHERWQQENES